MFGSNKWRKVGCEKKKKTRIDENIYLLERDYYCRPIERYHDNDYIQIE
jgi:hypothetical protein